MNSYVHRILVVDDNPSIHDDFRKILRPSDLTRLDAMAAEVFNRPAHKVVIRNYELDFASQGEEAFGKVLKALRDERPFSMAFVDMRIPPGWDGLRTISEIWEVDPNVQVAICSAYSDYSWQEIGERLGFNDRLLILKKPFDVAEAAQIACAMTEKWMLARQANAKTIELERMVNERTRELKKANETLVRANQQLHAFYEVEFERNHLRDSVRSMEQVLGIIGHELREPLGSIRMFSEMTMKMVGASDAVASKLIEGINHTAQEMAHILEDLLEAARLNSELAKWNWSKFAVAQVCQEAMLQVWPVENQSPHAPLTHAGFLRTPCHRFRRNKSRSPY